MVSHDQSLLSILKHKTVEKTVEKCELVIAHPSITPALDDSQEHDSLESTLTVRLHCHHGESAAVSSWSTVFTEPHQVLSRPIGSY
jgi:hypothetical protein